MNTGVKLVTESRGQAPSTFDRPSAPSRQSGVRAAGAKGQALVEFALAITLIIPILVGMFDLGHGIYIYSVVASAAREGARYGITDPTNTSAIVNVAKANTAGLDSSQINVSSSCSPDCTAGSDLSVTVGYRFQPVTIFFTSINLTGKTTMTIE